MCLLVSLYFKALCCYATSQSESSLSATEVHKLFNEIKR